ncbi:IclR family transcriptional regulator [Phytobacter sp. V91]|uniref:IclR family transcriptional regulator n=1 Tax=Phytobacter sp. V91 TaxID=3369425 RepID=UPI003F5DD38F
MDMMQTNAESDEQVPTSERVLMVLRIVAEYGRPVSASELIQASGLNKSTLYRLLASLRRWGFVMESEAMYAPGPACLQMALNFDAVSLLSLHANDRMIELRDLTQETVAITVVMQQEAVCISMLEPRQSLRCSFEKGRSLPLHRGATAKCLLAHLPVPVRKHILQAHFSNMFEREGQEKALAAIVEQGYACSESEVDAGVWGVSVPILSPNQQLLGALTLMAPVIRTQNQHQRLIDETLSAASRIQESLNTTFMQASPAFLYQS